MSAAVVPEISTTPAVESAAPAEEPRHDAGPVPMSFPAILRNPGVARFVQERQVEGASKGLPVTKKGKRDERGKRWIRRDENDRFVGNPHIVRATRKDYAVPVPALRSTFPEPLPSYLSRNTKVAPTTLPIRDPISANAGRFSLSLKGMRRQLRSHGPRTQQLVRDIEREVAEWLHDGGALHAPDATDANALSLPGRQIGQCEDIREVSRTPLQLVWAIEEDAFARYVVHCCARYHEIVSFSKDTSGQRLTYLLRPNVTKPDFRATSMLDTPPVTDLSSHEVHTDTESDFITDADARSLADADLLSAIVSGDEAASAGGESRSHSPGPTDMDDWSLIDDADADGDESGGEAGLVESIASLALSEDVDATPRPVAALRQRAFRTGAWDGRHGRSGSSPSRSPARRAAARRAHAVVIPRAQACGPVSFYDYLFA